MTGFTEAWLATRRPWDRRALSRDLLCGLAAWCEGRRRPVGIADFGCGTGNGPDALDAVIRVPVGWHLFDTDPLLLERAAGRRLRRAGSSLTVTRCDLAAVDPERLFEGIDMVTAFALLDLVSRPWLDRFWKRASARRIAVFAALTYDGRMSWTPACPLDAVVRDRLNRHQMRDKGFGPALGPRAAAALAGLARVSGWRVLVRNSDWFLSGRRDRAGLAMLLDGWVKAVREVSPELSGPLVRWRGDRLADPDVTLRVGHRDLLALPPGARPACR